MLQSIWRVYIICLILLGGFFISVRAGVSAAGIVTSVSGPFLQRGTVVIMGSGFGVKQQAPPLRWDDFESGTIGNNLATPVVGGKWNLYSANNNQEPKYSDFIVRANSSKSARCDFTRSNYNSSFGIQDKTGGFSTVYLDGWFYYDAAAPFSRNFKLYRMYYWSGGTPNFYSNLYCYPNADDTIHVTQDGGGVDDWWVNSYGSPWFAKTWRHVQTYMVQSGAGQSNGIIKLWLDGRLVVNSTNANTRGSGESSWDTLWIGNYGGHDAASPCGSYGDFASYWDDVYVDTTQARVEIGDKPDYTSCVHREIQIPSAWSDNAISITVNAGSFRVGDRAYLFVVDANGNVNSPGSPITIGTASDDVLAAPNNLRIAPQ